MCNSNNLCKLQQVKVTVHFFIRSKIRLLPRGVKNPTKPPSFLFCFKRLAVFLTFQASKHHQKIPSSDRSKLPLFSSCGCTICKAKTDQYCLASTLTAFVSCFNITVSRFKWLKDQKRKNSFLSVHLPELDCCRMT